LAEPNIDAVKARRGQNMKSSSAQQLLKSATFFRDAIQDFSSEYPDFLK
jgi:hypothetical protein